MKTIVKLFPAPHIEIRIHVSDEMKRDYQECKVQRVEKDCEKCSWWGANIGWSEGACDLPEMQELLREGMRWAD